MWAQFLRIFFPASTPFLSISAEEGTSKTLGICLREKESLEPVAELRSWEGHHSCAPSQWNLPKGNQWMLFLEYSYKLYHSCLTETQRCTISLQHELWLLCSASKQSQRLLYCTLNFPGGKLQWQRHWKIKIFSSSKFYPWRIHLWTLAPKSKHGQGTWNVTAWTQSQHKIYTRVIFIKKIRSFRILRQLMVTTNPYSFFKKAICYKLISPPHTG